MPAQAKTRKRNVVDQHVGARVRERRKELGMNQSALAKHLGLTFQMVQRYEYGLCRISASTLYAAAIALEVPIDFFFDGLPLPTGSGATAPKFEPSWQLLSETREGRTIARLFPRIGHRGSSRALAALVRAIVQEP
jgi:transcriptional regulator with XRE-family HTH domain